MYGDIPNTSVVVQKYGGTSVGSPERIRNVAARVARQYRAGWRRMAVVVSAMSGETNRLVALVRDVNPQASAKNYDMAVAAGEQVAVALLAAALEGEGVAAEPFLAWQLGIVTDEAHARARIRSIRRDKVETAWAHGRIPIVAGFQGMTEDMEITTLGRGGSDTSAVALGVALDAAFCEINTDVDGVYTCDPRIVPAARLLEEMDYEVALEMASLGSKVLHPRCVELGAKYKLPIVVRNTFTTDDHQRTRVMTQTTEIESLAVSGVTLDKDVARVTVSGLGSGSVGISELFSVIAQRGINVDIIVHDKPGMKSEPGRLGFTVAKGDLSATVETIGQLAKKSAGSGTGASVRADTESGLAKVSVVGVGMRSYAGVAGKTFAALSDAGIQIHMISTSEIKISCVIAETDGAKACQVLHKAFFENQ